jgi:N-acyl-phosphatidylethanolamine-hydrolysing phospholipase D
LPVGPFDAAAIPIGAHSPRWFMSSIHVNPVDAVDIHVDIKSKKSVGIHWGTFVLTSEDIHEPPIALKAAVKERGLKEDDFDVVKIGETMWV